jgi:hypothetical protein
MKFALGTIAMLVTGCVEPAFDHAIASASECIGDDAQEPNDSAFEAMPVEDLERFDGSVCPGDEDWFAFTITEPTWVGIFVRHDGIQGDLDFELRDAESGVGNLAAIADGDDVDYSTLEAIHRRLTLPGTYKVRVHLESGEGAVGYEIRFDLLPDR